MMGISPEIIVTVSPTSIDFQWKENQLRLEPYVNIDIEKMLPVQIGKNEEVPGAFLVGVFDVNSEMSLSPDKFSVLQLIFGYGIGKMFEKQRLPVFKPLIIVHGDDSLREILCGYQRKLLYDAIMESNARNCKFE